MDLPGHEVLGKLSTDVGEQRGRVQRPRHAALHEVAVQHAPVHAARHPAIERRTCFWVQKCRGLRVILRHLGKQHMRREGDRQHYLVTVFEGGTDLAKQLQPDGATSADTCRTQTHRGRLLIVSG